MEDDPQQLALADTVSSILAELGADDTLDSLAEQMGRLIAELQTPYLRAIVYSS